MVPKTWEGKLDGLIKVLREEIERDEHLIDTLEEMKRKGR